MAPNCIHLTICPCSLHTSCRVRDPRNFNGQSSATELHRRASTEGSQVASFSLDQRRGRYSEGSKLAAYRSPENTLHCRAQKVQPRERGLGLSDANAIFRAGGHILFRLVLRYEHRIRPERERASTLGLKTQSNTRSVSSGPCFQRHTVCENPLLFFVRYRTPHRIEIFVISTCHSSMNSLRYATIASVAYQ